MPGRSAEPSFGSLATIALRDDDPPNTPATGVPTIRGTAQVGETLSASTDGITDPDGKPANASDYTYQWQSVDEDGTSNETDIGTDSSTYTAVAADVGKRIRVKVSFTDDVGHSEGPLTSAATAAVTPVPVTIEAEHTSIGGGLEDLVYTLTRAGDTADALSVTVTLTQDETWLTNLSHTVTFNDGEAEKGLTILAADFSLAPTAKGDLTATVSGVGVGGDSVDVEVISIDHEPVTIAFDKTAYSFPEGGAAEEVDIYLTATVDAAFPRPPAEDFSVIGGLVPGTATVREDFVSFSSVAMSFQPSEFTASVDAQQVARILFGPSGGNPLVIVNDNIYEGDETFGVQIDGMPGRLSSGPGSRQESRRHLLHRWVLQHPLSRHHHRRGRPAGAGAGRLAGEHRRGGRRLHHRHGRERVHGDGLHHQLEDLRDRPGPEPDLWRQRDLRHALHGDPGGRGRERGRPPGHARGGAKLGRRDRGRRGQRHRRRRPRHHRCRGARRRIVRQHRHHHAARRRPPQHAGDGRADD